MHHNVKSILENTLAGFVHLMDLEEVLVILLTCFPRYIVWCTLTPRMPDKAAIGTSTPSTDREDDGLATSTIYEQGYQLVFIRHELVVYEPSSKMCSQTPHLGRCRVNVLLIKDDI